MVVMEGQISIIVKHWDASRRGERRWSVVARVLDSRSRRCEFKSDTGRSVLRLRELRWWLHECDAVVLSRSASRRRVGQESCCLIMLVRAYVLACARLLDGRLAK